MRCCGKRLLCCRRARQAATCGRCRAELGEGGRVCAHCRLDERWLAWELRLFSLQSRALAAGAAVSAADALRQVSTSTTVTFASSVCLTDKTACAGCAGCRLARRGPCAMTRCMLACCLLGAPSRPVLAPGAAKHRLLRQLRALQALTSALSACACDCRTCSVPRNNACVWRLRGAARAAPRQAALLPACGPQRAPAP